MISEHKINYQWASPLPGWAHLKWCVPLIKLISQRRESPVDLKQAKH